MRKMKITPMYETPSERGFHLMATPINEQDQKAINLLEHELIKLVTNVKLTYNVYVDRGDPYSWIIIFYKKSAI